MLYTAPSGGIWIRNQLNWSKVKAWLLLLPFGASILGQQQSRIRLPDETVGSDRIVKTLISAFDHADIVALGDDHWRKLDSDLRIALVRNTAFAKRVRFIVVEFGSTAQQPTLDRYIRGEEVPLAQLQQVWKATTQTNGVWDSPLYADFFAAVREVNKKLPAGARVRVLAGDPPAGSHIDRDTSAISILKERVLEKHGKALLIYGPGHLFRTSLPGVVGITKTLEADYPGRTFVVITLGGPYPEYDKFEHALKTTVRPVLVSLKRSPFRDFTAEEFLGSSAKNFVNGEWVSAYQGSSVTLGQMADACIYLGRTLGVDLRIGPVP
ncbi:MAG TPA: hypothetical protein VGQ49_06290 [Bryobacteraceae bacterium]|nr:hypothetical protein [Bryobacteraceae bacterium]